MKDQIKRVLLSTDKNVINENMEIQELPKNCQMYHYMCPKCSKKFRQESSMKKHTEADNLLNVYTVTRDTPIISL